MKHLHPHASRQFIVHVLVELMLLKDPTVYLVLVHEIADNADGIVEVTVYLLLSKTHPVGSVGITSYVVIVLDAIIFEQTISVLQEKVAPAVVTAENAQNFRQRLLR
jgi:hypothetical protein